MMTALTEVIEHCQRQQELIGRPDAVVSYRVYGKPWGRRQKVRLWPGGPLGRIVGDMFDRPGVVALFPANEVIAAATRLIWQESALMPDRTGDGGE